MRSLFFAAALATQTLIADVVITDRPNKRFLVLWKDTPTTIRIKTCISIPDDGRPRDCEERTADAGRIMWFTGLTQIQNALSSGQRTHSLAEVTQALEKNQNQRNAKRVIDIETLDREKQDLEREQNNFLLFERFQRALENEDLDIDLEKGKWSERDLASAIINRFDLERRSTANTVQTVAVLPQARAVKKYKTTHGPARDARYFSGWIEGQGAMARYSGFYSFNLWNRADFGGPVVHREDAQGRLTRNAVMDTTRTPGVFKDTGGSEKHGLVIRGNSAEISIDGVYHGTIYEEDLGERITSRK